MTHKELVDQVSANLFKQSGRLESERSWLAIRNYLEQLDTDQLKLILKEALNKNRIGFLFHLNFSLSSSLYLKS